MTAIIFAWLAFERRWMSDDGLIVIRTVRQLLDGSGPVINAFERAEASTSTLWTYLLALLGALTGADLAKLAVYTGLVLAIAAIVIAMLATARLRGGAVPGSVLVVLGVSAFWDYATSGLETGLCFAWLAVCWWLLVTLSRPRLLLSAFVFGLGPLVRPDFALVSSVFFAVAVYIERPSRRCVLAACGIALALPLAYELFRAGYYGVLVPLPALAKSASEPAWTRGLAYLCNFIQPYVLWLPLATLIALAIADRRPVPRRERAIAIAPAIAAVLHAAYVLRAGGDFMHARLLLPATLLVLLPTFVLPLRRATVPALAVLATWAVVIAMSRGAGTSPVIGPGLIGDERLGYVRWTRRNHPIDPGRFVLADRPAAQRALLDVLLGRRRLLSQDMLIDVPMNPARPGPYAYAVGRLGTGGAAVPLDAIVADTFGLASPLGARITKTQPGATGHEKRLPPAWLLADYADPAASAPGVPRVLVEAARRAMQCGELAELLASVRAPLTVSRFWANLTGSLRRTRLVIPADPAEAEHRFCGDRARSIVVTASTSWEHDGCGRYSLVDGERATTPSSPGYTSTAAPPQWIELRFAAPRRISGLVLYPIEGGAGFPVDLAVEVWDGSGWRERVRRTDIAVPTTSPQTLSWTPADDVARVRLVVTRIAADLPRAEVKLAEIEVLP